MLIRKCKPVTQPATKKLAMEFSQMESVPNDRPLGERRLAVYERLISQGDFYSCIWAKVFCKETGVTYRVNGKHTSNLLSSIERMPDFYVTVESFECETLHEVAALYSQFDSRLQSRTAADIFVSFAGTVPELRELSRRAICHAAAGLGYAMWTEESGKKPAADKAELLLEHSDFVLWSCQILTGHSAAHIDRGPAIAAMFGAWKRSQSAASEFWIAVRDETGEKPTQPDRRLAKFLTLARINCGKSRVSTHNVTQREMYVKCIHFWNAWRQGTTSDGKYFPAAKVPTFK